MAAQTSRYGGYLCAGQHYCTKSGRIVIITLARRGIASGFFIDSHEYNEWHIDGRDTGHNNDSEENISSEVTK